MSATTTTNTETRSRITKQGKGNTRTRISATQGSKKTAPPKTTSAGVASDQRMKMVAEAAYYLAEQRGFSEGNAENDWYTAETQIDQLLSSS